MPSQWFTKANQYFEANAPEPLHAIKIYVDIWTPGSVSKSGGVIFKHRKWSFGAITGARIYSARFIGDREAIAVLGMPYHDMESGLYLNEAKATIRIVETDEAAHKGQVGYCIRKLDGTTLQTTGGDPNFPNLLPAAAWSLASVYVITSDELPDYLASLS